MNVVAKPTPTISEQSGDFDEMPSRNKKPFYSFPTGVMKGIKTMTRNKRAPKSEAENIVEGDASFDGWALSERPKLEFFLLKSEKHMTKHFL